MQIGIYFDRLSYSNNMVLYKFSKSFGSFRRFLLLTIIFIMTIPVIQAQTSIEELLREEGFAIASDRRAATNITLQGLDGEPTSLSSYRGNVVFLNFWATWCGPCRSEMPSMEKLHIAMSSDNFKIIAVDLSETSDQVAEFVEELGLTFPILLDESGMYGTIYDVKRIPTTYLLDKEGRFIARYIGPRDWNTESFIALVRKLIDE